MASRTGAFDNAFASIRLVMIASEFQKRVALIFVSFLHSSQVGIRLNLDFLLFVQSNSTWAHGLIFVVKFCQLFSLLLRLPRAELFWIYDVFRFSFCLDFVYLLFRKISQELYFQLLLSAAKV